jgi:ATP-dependent Lon protease
MSYKGEWKLQKEYERGDIIYNKEIDYFVCLDDHVSDNTMYPTNEDIYWINIHSSFLTTYLVNFVTITEPMINKKSTKTTKKISREYSFSDSEKEKEEREYEFIKKPKNKLKRKLNDIEDEIYEYKRIKNNEIDDNDIKSKILLLNVDISTKTFILDKFNSLKKPIFGSDGDYNKNMTWIKTALDIPFGKYKELQVDINDSSRRINDYFKKVKAIMDKHVHGLDNIKQEIIEYIAKRISNPQSKGQILALHGSPGIAKTCLLRSLGEALDLPFQQISFGGLSDASILTGHSETYVGSKAGKIVEALQRSQAMNMILYLDEIDKISSGKSKEINGVLTHLLDEQQNSHFQDTYLSNIDLDLSKIFFVVSFNDISKVSSIVTDRMKIINIDTPTTEEKIQIANLKLMPEIIKELNFHKNFKFIFDKDLMYTFMKRHSKDNEGMRQIKKKLENIFNKINYLHLTDTLDDSNLLIDDTIEPKTGEITNTIVTITQGFIDLCLKEKRELSYNMMYV